mgnify:FL=1
MYRGYRATVSRYYTTDLLLTHAFHENLFTPLYTKLLPCFACCTQHTPQWLKITKNLSYYFFRRQKMLLTRKTSPSPKASGGSLKDVLN